MCRIACEDFNDNTAFLGFNPEGHACFIIDPEKAPYARHNERIKNRVAMLEKMVKEYVSDNNLYDKKWAKEFLENMELSADQRKIFDSQESHENACDLIAKPVSF